MSPFPPPALPVSGLRLLAAWLLPLMAVGQPAPQDNWTLDRTVTFGDLNAGLLNAPTGVRVLSDGRIAVTDSGNNRVQIFDATGGNPRIIAQGGSSDGLFNEPSGIVELQDGNLAIADTVGHRIQVITKDGTFVRKWGTFGSESGQFKGPRGLELLTDGKIAVCDRENRRIQIFEPNGTYSSQWITAGFPEGIALIPGGQLAVTLAWNNAITVLNPDGSLVRTLPFSGTGDGQFNSPTGIVALRNGNLAVSDSSNHRIQIIQPDGSFIRKWGSQGAGDGSFSSPSMLAVDASGRILVADSLNHRIQIFNEEGTFQGKFGLYGYGGSSGIPYYQVRSLETDEQGNFIVLGYDFSKPQLTLIAPSGAILSRFRLSSKYYNSNGHRAKNGKLYVGYNSHFEVYRMDGTLELSVGSPNSPSSTPGLFGNVGVIPVPDAEGNIYAADIGNGRVQKFSANGTFLLSFGEPGTGPGQLSDMTALGISPDGNVVVTGSYNSKKQRFSPNGTLLESTNGYFPSAGNGPGPILYAPDGTSFAQGWLSRSDDTGLFPAQGYNRRTGEFYRIDGTNKIQVWRRGFRSLGANPPRAVPAPGISATRQRPSGLVDIDYSVTDPDSPTVTTALVAYRAGTSLIRDLVVLRAEQLVESTATKVGANIATGTSHRVTWNPSTSGLYSGELVFEALARDDRPKLIDLDFITLPGATPLTISRSPLLHADFRTLWAWLLATGDAALTRAADGEVVGPGGTFTSTNGTETLTTAPGRAWLLAKLGVREATADEVQRARVATSTSGSPNRFTPTATQRMGALPRAINEWTFDTWDYGADAWWVVPLQ